MCQEALDLEGSIGGERNELMVRAWTSCRVQTSLMCRLSHWSGQEQNLLQWLQALGAQEMQWDQVLGQRP